MELDWGYVASVGLSLEPKIMVSFQRKALKTQSPFSFHLHGDVSCHVTNSELQNGEWGEIYPQCLRDYVEQASTPPQPNPPQLVIQERTKYLLY